MSTTDTSADRLMLDLEQTDWDLCGQAGGSTIYEGYDVKFKTSANQFTLIACANCGHIYLNPRPTIEDLGVIYANYLTTNAESAYHPSKLIAWIKCNIFDKARMRHILKAVENGGTTSAPAWNMSIRNSVGLDALSTTRSVFEIFNYRNVVTLGFFTVIAIVLLGLGVHTSTQQLICRKAQFVEGFAFFSS